MSHVSSQPSTPKGQLSAENTPSSFFSQLISRIEEPASDSSRPSLTADSSDETLANSSPSHSSSDSHRSPTVTPLSQRRKNSHKSPSSDSSMSPHPEPEQSPTLNSSPPFSHRRKRQRKVGDNESHELSPSALSPPTPEFNSSPPASPVHDSSEPAPLSERRKCSKLSITKPDEEDEAAISLQTPMTPPSPSAPFTPSLSSSSSAASSPSSTPATPSTPPMDMEVRQFQSPVALEADELKDSSNVFLSPDVAPDAAAYATPDLQSEPLEKKEQCEPARETTPSKSNLKFILSDDNSNDSISTEGFDMSSFFSPHIKKEDTKDLYPPLPPTSDSVQNRKRSKSESATTATPPSAYVSNRLRKRASPSPSDPLSSPTDQTRAKYTKRTPPPPRAPSTRNRSQSFSPTPSPTPSPYVSQPGLAHQHDLSLPMSHHPHSHPHNPTPYHLSHPPRVDSYNYPVHSSPHHVVDPYSYYYSSHNSNTVYSAPSNTPPPTSYSPPPSIVTPAQAQVTPSAPVSPTASAASRNKVPCCTRCSARAAWKHDKKGKRWFCKICKLPFTPGVSPANKLKEVVTIPPCPKCYSNEGWKQEKNKFFCTQCKRSFRPRVSRSSTRVTPARTAKKGYYYEEDEEEDEDEEEEREKEETGEDSDFGNDMSPVAPDVETNLSYYRGKNSSPPPTTKSPPKNSSAQYSKMAITNEYSKHYTTRRGSNVDYNQVQDHSKPHTHGKEESFDDHEDALQMLLELKSKSR